MATLSPVAAAVGLNTDPQFPASANVLTNVANQSHILTNAMVSVIQLTNTLTGWMPVKVGTNAMFMDVDVTSAWMTNSAVTNVQLLVNYYDSGTGGIKVYYDSRTNGFTLAGTITLSNSLAWINAAISLPVPAFSNRCRGADISLSFPDTSSTILSFVKVMTVQSQLMNGTTNVSNATALFSGTPTNGARPLAVTFTDQSTGSITNLLWNFGDGQTTNTAGGAVIAHTYTIAGSYPVTLIASGLGGVSTNTKPGYVTVNVPAPPNLGGISVASLTNVRLTGTGGPTNGLYYYWVRSATNLTLPLTNWSVLSTNPFNPDGSFTNTMPITPGAPQQFYRLQLP
jgi:PKD repeat protein